MLQYPYKIVYTRLDTNLNAIVPLRPVRYFHQKSRYAFTGAGIISAAPDRIVISYSVRDSNIANAPRSVANKFLILNGQGDLIADDFIGWEPGGTGPAFPSHSTVNLFRNEHTNTYWSVVRFEDIPWPGDYFTLFRLDSNLQLHDTFDFPEGLYLGPELPGMILYSYGFFSFECFFLPTGSMVTVSKGHFADKTDGALCDYYGIGKGGLETGYRVSSLYMPPRTDSADFDRKYAFKSTCHNRYDNRIYSFWTTSSQYGGCLADRPMLGQLCAIDTNLKEQWIKYVRPRPGHCIGTSAIAPADGRKGVIISGFELSPPGGGAPRPFIYYVDSTTSLGMDNAQGPLLISGQFSLHPNPAADYVTIENVLATAYNYSVINSIGQRVLSGKGNGVHARINIANLPAGAYIVAIQAIEGRSFSLKLHKR